MRKFIFLLVLSSLIIQRSNAQYSPLKIGDKVPDVAFGKFLDSPSVNLRISNLKGKLIILDFWNIHCANCIKGMPKMEALQKKFGNQLQIISITKNSEQQVKRLFSKVKIKRPNFPFVIEDTLFNLLFPHNGDPLHVWINKDGVVSAITFDYNTNMKTVSQMLNGIEPNLSRRWDYGIKSDYNLVSEQNSSLLDKAINYSVLFKGLHEYSVDNTINTRDSGIKVINGTLLQLYNIAYSAEVYGFPVNIFDIDLNNRTQINVKEKDRFFVPEDEDKLAEWFKNNLYSYELKLPDKDDVVKYRYMQEDLNRYLPYKITIEKLLTKCIVLVKTSDGITIKTKNSTSIPLFEFRPGSSFFIQNMSIETLISQLIYSNTALKIPIVDATNYKDNIDLELKSKLYDIPSLTKELQAYGFDLVEQEKYIDMLIIQDKPESK